MLRSWRIYAALLDFDMAPRNKPLGREHQIENRFMSVPDLEYAAYVTKENVKASATPAAIFANPADQV